MLDDIERIDARRRATMHRLSANRSLQPDVSLERVRSMKPWFPPDQQMKPLDVYGIDEADVYHPPSRARYEQWVARDNKLEARVKELETRETELQTKGTKLTNEVRKWKARATSATEFLHLVTVEIPIAGVMVQKGIFDEETKNDLAEIYKTHERMDQLLKDVWSGTAELAKQFIKDAVALREANRGQRSAALDFVEAWRIRFKAAFEDDS